MSVTITPLSTTDDDGSGTTGSIYNAARQLAFEANINTALVGVIAADAAVAAQTTTLTGAQADFALTPGVALLRVNNASTVTFSGLAAGSDSQRLVLVAIGAGTVVLTDQDAGSAAANRIITEIAGPLTLAASVGWAILSYDITTARWRVTASSVVSAGGAPIEQTTTLTGTQNNFALTSAASTLLCNNASAMTLTGLAAGTDGQQLLIEATGAGGVTLLMGNAGSLAANRFGTYDGVTTTITVPTAGSVRLVYISAGGGTWVVAQAASAVVLAPLVSPALTGTPSAPTAAAGDKTTLLATTAFVQAARAPRVTSVASSATPAPNADTDDLYDLTALAAAAAFTNPSGTPVNGQKLIIRIKDNATARALTWGTAYIAGGVALPSTTILSKILTLGFLYNTANALNKWQCVASSQEA